jgi:hypothetical protein
MSIVDRLSPISAKSLLDTSGTLSLNQANQVDDSGISQFASQEGMFFNPAEGKKAVPLKLVEKNISVHDLNALAAEFIGFVSRIMIERNYFQNSNIPADLLFHLANSLIKILNPEKKETVNMAKELTLIWKQLRGYSLTSEDQKYLDNPKEIDVIGEILNGVAYSSLTLLGQNLYTSVTSTIKQGLNSHFPAIFGSFSVSIFGARVIDRAVNHILQYSQLNQNQKEIIEPWLHMVGRLALGFFPKVHANKDGVYIHYPSTQGLTQTFSKGQTATLHGDTLTIEREGQLNTPEGSFEGTHYAEFKLGSISEISEERIRIKVIDNEGKTVPVEFTKIQGKYGPEIQVNSKNELLKQYWQKYFPTKVNECQNALVIGALGTLSTMNVFPLAVGAFSCFGVNALSQPSQIKKMVKEKGLLGTLIEYEKTSKQDSSSTEVHQHKLTILQELARHSLENWILALSEEIDKEDGLNKTLEIESLIKKKDFYGALLECDKMIYQDYIPFEINYQVLSIVNTLFSELKSFTHHDENLNEIQELIHKDEFLAALEKCDKIIKKGNPPPDVYYYKVLNFIKLGRFKEAYATFNLTSSLKSPIEINSNERKEIRKKIVEFLRNPIDWRTKFLNEIGVTSPSHYEYLVMGAIVRFYREWQLSDESFWEPMLFGSEKFIHWKNLQLKGWEIGKTTPDLGIEQEKGFGIGFINNRTKHMIIAYSVYPEDTDAIPFVEKLAELYREYFISHAGYAGGAGLANGLANKRNEIAITAENTYLMVPTNKNVYSVTYFATPNPLNIFPHVGEIRTILPIKREQLSTLDHIPSRKRESLSKVEKIIILFWDIILDLTWYPMKNTLWNLMRNLSFMLTDPYNAKKLEKIFQTSLDFNIFDILRAFDSESGYPKRFQYVTKWPQGEKELNDYYLLTLRNENNQLIDETRKKHSLYLEDIYKTEDSNISKMKLSRFTPAAQEVIKKYFNECQYLSNINPRVLKLSHIVENEIMIKSDCEIFSVEDFKNYLEHKVNEALKKKIVKYELDSSKSCKINKGDFVVDTDDSEIDKNKLVIDQESLWNRYSAALSLVALVAFRMFRR